jgi:hypothetical protein
MIFLLKNSIERSAITDITWGKIVKKIIPSILLLNSLVMLPVKANYPLDNSTNTELSLKQLGAYQLTFEEVIEVAHVSGQNLLAKSQERPGENFSTYLPFSIQQSQFLIANGSKILKGQAVAHLEGYDVHHFLEEYQAAETLFKNAKQQYQTGLNLYQQKALSQSRWTEISDQYFKAKLHFGHLGHLNEFLMVNDQIIKDSDEEKRVSIVSSISGTVRYKATKESKNEGDLLFDVIPDNALRLVISVPMRNVQQLAKVKVLDNDFILAIDPSTTENNIISNFNTIVWSEPINSTCDISLGESMVVTPIYLKAAFSINKKAVFEINDQSHIAVKKGNQLELIAVELQGTNQNNYLFTSQQSLVDRSVLVSSVSALQGILLELGTGAE